MLSDDVVSPTAHGASATTAATGAAVPAALRQDALLDRRDMGLRRLGRAEVEQRFQQDYAALPLNLATRLRVVPLRPLAADTSRLTLLLGDPLSVDVQLAIDHHLPNAEVEFAVADGAADHAAGQGLVDDLLARAEEEASALASMGDALADGEAADDLPVRPLLLDAVGREPNPVIRFVDSILLDAINLGASDVHLERTRAGLCVKLRLDGVLEPPPAPTVGAQMAEQIIARVKVLADLDVTEHRVPQDGRARFRVVDRGIDVRVSILPGSFGEEAVLRILDKKTLAGINAGLSLERLGFDPRCIASMRALARRPYGMLLVTGPTGSGKSTTLYAALSEINTGQDKIITIEDPVEYELPGVLQIPVNERKGLTFARGLRSILRHDPDRILVGEIRDAETAQIAIQAALTGHLVFTTVHANDAFDVIGRLMHMGVEPYAFMNAINGVVAQRLVRRVCSACLGRRREPGEAACGVCRGTGYRGRLAIGELLEFDDTLRTMVVERRPLAEAKKHAHAQGLRGLRARALELVEAGLTTREEADRVTVA
jgi:general secretion pathway protein E